MRVLAIETSCDETAVAVIEANGDDIAVLSNVVSSQIELHAQYGGVVPALAAREHAANIGHVFETALKESGVTNFANDIDLIAVTHGPGLGPALLVGITFARTLAWQYNKPLIGINHMDGHIHSNWLEPQAPIGDDIFPALNLVVSGGHTELVLMHAHGEYEIIGETHDDAIGEAFDKVARLLDLGYPGGPKISMLAESGNQNAYSLPRPMANSGDYNFSYSGLKTAVLYLIRDLTNNERGLTEKEKTDIAASFQNAAIDVLIQKTKAAIKHYQPKALLLSGGVSANKLLREQLHQMASESSVRFICPIMKYTTDNAAMIAVAGYYAFRNTQTVDWQNIDMDANLRLGHNTKI